MKFSPLTLRKLRDLLISHGAEEVEKKSNGKRYDLSKVAIIISNTTDFPEYEDARARMIPVAKREWVRECVKRGKVIPLRPYSPNNKDVLATINVVCVGLERSDKAVIHEAMWSLGGMATTVPTYFTTHFIVDSLEDQNVQALRKNSSTKHITMISKKWVLECLKHRKLVPEGKFLFDGTADVENYFPAIGSSALKGKAVFLGHDLGLSESTVLELKNIFEFHGGQLSTHIKSCHIYVGKYRDGEEYLRACCKGKVVGSLSWLIDVIAEGKYSSPLKKLFHYPAARTGLPEMKDMVISITNYTGDSRKYLQALIEGLGARFTRQLRDDNTHLITARPVGAKYAAAKSWNINTVNHLWLEETYASWEVKSIAEPAYIQAGKNKSSTPAIGSTPLDSEVLKEFFQGEKCGLGDSSEESQEENEGSAKMEEGSKEPSPLPEEVQNVEEDDDLALQHRETEHAPQQSNNENQDQTRNVLMTLPSSPLAQIPHQENNLPDVTMSSPIPGSSPGLDPHTPMSKLAADAALLAFSTGGRSGRAAKDKAAAKLHQDMTDLNEFQKSIKSKKFPLLPDEVKKALVERANSKMRSSPSAPSSSAPNGENDVMANDTPTKSGKKKRAAKLSKPEDAEATPSAKKQKASKGYSMSPEHSSQIQPDSQQDTVYLLITGIEEPSTANKRALSKLGVKLISDARKATHVIAPRVCKTQNFLVSLANSPVLLDRSFLEACYSSGGQPRPEPEMHLLKDPSGEKEILDGTIAEMLSRAHELKQSGGLLQGYRFNIAPNIRGGFDVINEIVLAHGGYPCVPIKNVSKVNVSEPCDDGKVILLAASEQHGFIDSFKKLYKDSELKPYCYTAEWLLVSILRMEVNFEREGAL